MPVMQPTRPSTHYAPFDTPLGTQQDAQPSVNSPATSSPHYANQNRGGQGMFDMPANPQAAIGLPQFTQQMKDQMRQRLQLGQQAGTRTATFNAGQRLGGDVDNPAMAAMLGQINAGGQANNAAAVGDFEAGQLRDSQSNTLAAYNALLQQKGLRANYELGSRSADLADLNSERQYGLGTRAADLADRNYNLAQRNSIHANTFQDTAYRDAQIAAQAPYIQGTPQNQAQQQQQMMQLIQQAIASGGVNNGQGDIHNLIMQLLGQQTGTPGPGVGGNRNQPYLPESAF